MRIPWISRTPARRDAHRKRRGKASRIAALAVLVLVPVFGGIASESAWAITCVGQPSGITVTYGKAFNGSQGGDPMISVANRGFCGNGGPASHTGIDWDLNDNGPATYPVFATASSIIVTQVSDPTPPWSSCYGNYIAARSNIDNVYVEYAHLSQLNATGQAASKGAVLGYSGMTGSCPDGVHIHLSTTKNWTNWTNSSFFDPRTFFQNHGWTAVP